MKSREIAEGEEVGLEFLGLFLGLAEEVAGAPQDHLAAVLDVAVDRVLEVQEAGATLVDRQHVHREARRRAVCL